MVNCCHGHEGSINYAYEGGLCALCLRCQVSGFPGLIRTTPPPPAY